MTNNSLASDFNLRTNWFVNRASAVFPIYFVNKENDLFISFLNYWKIKNNNDKVILVFRIYNSSGQLKARQYYSSLKNNNCFSIRSVIKDLKFQGMVDVEVISTENLRYPFPAITGIFKSKDYFSSVHSAGRIRGVDEPQTQHETLETNWTCKFEKNITPFFHYFNGPRYDKPDLKVALHSPEGRKVREVFLNKKEYRPFESKIFLIDKLFKKNNFKRNMFISVKCQNSDVFRRMVVGNLHKKINHLEVTHSFPWQNKADYCPSTINKVPGAILNLYKNKKLDLKARIFPTNSKGSIRYSVKLQTESNKKLELCLTKAKDNFQKKNFGEIFLKGNNLFKVIYLYGNKVPSRFNTSLVYKVKKKSSFSTDIATGAKSIVYPKKYSHWGSGVVGLGYDTSIMIRNNSHDGKSNKAKGTLYIYTHLKDPIKINISVNEESCKSFFLSTISKKTKDIVSKNKVTIFTWFVKFDQQNLEIIWVSYKKSNGCILGDHSF